MRNGLGWLPRLCCVLLVTTVNAVPPDHAQWEPTFADEFDGDAVDWAVWESQAASRGGDRLEGRWPENNVVKDGILTQVTRREDPPRGGKGWSTAHVWTREFTQQYGYFEARMRYGRCLNNAFWLWRTRGRFPEPPHFEIDINEGHTPREVAMNYHFYAAAGPGAGELHSTGKRWDADVDLDADFHVYGCEWDEERIVWYYDGQPIRVLANPNAHAPADVRLSTVIIEPHLKRHDMSLADMDGVSMAVDRVRVYRKVKDLRQPELPEAERYELPTITERKRQIPPAAGRAPVFGSDFEALGDTLPAGWTIGDRVPAVVEDVAATGKPILAEGNHILRLAPGDYAYRLFDEPVDDCLEIELDVCAPHRGEGLLLVTLGEFDADNPERRADSYYTGDIGPYIHWYRWGFLGFYTEADKWTHFAGYRDGVWQRFRFVLDVGRGVFNAYDSEGAFLGGGVFRHRQQAARGVGLRNRGTGQTVYVDNVTVRRLD